MLKRKALVGVNNNDKPLWFGESSTGYNSGTKGVGDRYVSAFLLDFILQNYFKTIIILILFLNICFWS